MKGFRRAYADILASGKDAFRQIFLHIRDNPSEPCLIHCTAGKDRTGVISALILSIAGVNDQEIAEEYALTTQGLEPMRDLMLKHLRDNSALKDNEKV